MYVEYGLVHQKCMCQYVRTAKFVCYTCNIFFYVTDFNCGTFMYVCIYLFYELISNCVVCRASSCSAYLLVLIRFVCFCFYKRMIREADGSLNHYELYA